jgi:tight adherence protein C
MSRGMPDMLDLLNMCVSQGMTVPAALTRVSSEIEPVYPALARELKIVTDQSRIGTLEQALRAFSARVDASEVHSFTSLMIQTEQMGTSMSGALTEYSDNMRESFRQRADQKANAATFKMLFPTVLCLMPAVFMFLLGPATIELNEFFRGRGQEILDSNAISTELTGRPVR